MSDLNRTYTHHGQVKKWLLRIANDDDHDAFTSLLSAYWNKVYTQALVHLKSPDNAQTLTQDVFVKVWIHRDKLRGVNNFSAYLATMCRNEIFSMFRKRMTTIQPDETLQEEYWIPDRQLQQKRNYHTLLQAVELLPPMRKKVFTLSKLDGLSYDEIATRLNISRNGVKDHIVKALVFLRNYLRLHSGDLPVILCALLSPFT